MIIIYIKSLITKENFGSIIDVVDPLYIVNSSFVTIAIICSFFHVYIKRVCICLHFIYISDSQRQIDGNKLFILFYFESWMRWENIFKEWSWRYLDFLMLSWMLLSLPYTRHDRRNKKLWELNRSWTFIIHLTQSDLNPIWWFVLVWFWENCKKKESLPWKISLSKITSKSSK